MNESSVISAGAALLETMRWSPESGFFLLDGHLARLERSARRAGWSLELARIHLALEQAAEEWAAEPCRVRLCVDASGEPVVSAAPLSASPLPNPMRVKLAAHAIDSSNSRLYHKTTARGLYERARAARPGADDVLLYNERNEVTESTFANVVIERAGERWTPPVACGLLPGVYREHLLARGEIQEDVITLAEMRKAKRCFLINSVREWMPAVLLES